MIRPEDESYFQSDMRKDVSHQKRNEDCNCKLASDDPSNANTAKQQSKDVVETQKQPAQNEETANRGIPAEKTKENESYFTKTNPEEVKPAVFRDPNSEYYNSGKMGDYSQVGTASWYGRDFDGKKTASGAIFDSRKLTAAHKTLPLGTNILVRNLENDKETIVTVNDRGPFVSGRILDLSEAAAEELGFKEKGLTTVGIRVLAPGQITDNGPGATHEIYGNRTSTNPGVTRHEEKIHEVAIVPPTNKKDNVKPESAMKGYSVQVGVFNTLENAKGMKQYLTPYGMPVNILQRGNLYVVKVGNFPNRTRAEELKNRLSTDGYPGFVSEP